MRLLWHDDPDGDLFNRYYSRAIAREASIRTVAIKAEILDYLLVNLNQFIGIYKQTFDGKFMLPYEWIPTSIEIMKLVDKTFDPAH
jgi:hypothetical protein